MPDFSPVSDTKGFILLGQFTDQYGDIIELYAPSIPFDQINQQTLLSAWDNIIMLNLRTQKQSKVLPQMLVQMGIAPEQISSAITGAAIFDVAQRHNVNIYNPDIQDYLKNKIQDMVSGRQVLPLEFLEMGKKLEDPVFAMQMRAAGLMGTPLQEDIQRWQQFQQAQKPEEIMPQVWGGMKYSFPDEIKKGTKADIVISPSKDLAFRYGYRYIPTESFDTVKYFETKERLKAMQKAGYPQTDEFIEQQSRWVATKGTEPIALTEDISSQAQRVAQKNEEARLKQQMAEWEELRRKSTARPERIARL